MFIAYLEFWVHLAILAVCWCYFYDHRYVEDLNPQLEDKCTFAEQLEKKTG